jgi:exopolysaccharide biosynthesis WecB/TagA/CpsF family protein
MGAVRRINSPSTAEGPSNVRLRLVRDLSDTRTSSRAAQDCPVGANQKPVLRYRKVRVFGVSIADTTLRDAAEWMVDSAHRGIKQTVSFLNAHCLNVLIGDRAYKDAVEASDVVFADGAGISIAARAAGTRLLDNVNGTDLFPVICEEAAKVGVPIFLLGGKPGTTARTAARMMASYPGLSIAGSHHGYFSTPEEESRVINYVNSTNSGILLVGMGVPTQELWIMHNRFRLNTPVIAGVGGLFDYYSGRIPRAPRALRAAGLEWVWRLTMEPRRLARRYLVGNIAFLARLAWHRIVFSRGFSAEARI